MKIINSISFYVLATLGTIFVLSDELNRFTFIGLFILFVLYRICKNMESNEIYDLLGITWLQKKFKNNKVIMDLTNE